MSDLDFFFNPSSVAVIGASDSVGSIGYEIMKNMLDSFKIPNTLKICKGRDHSLCYFPMPLSMSE